jgi:CMP-N,N'-diacetyllegionaminic acid synthase
MVIKNICTILARGGSTGLKNKNTKILDGKPLIHHTIMQAIESKLFDTVVVSSDSDYILNISSEIKGIELVKRHIELANHTISKRPGIRHAIQEVENKYNCIYDNIIDLDPTSPLRTIEDIHNAFNQFNNDNNDNLVTAMLARKSPYFNMLQLSENTPKLIIESKPPITCRQDSPVCYEMNASIYMWKRSVLFNTESNFLETTGLYVMPEERSIDIDSEIDFELVDFLMKKSKNKGNKYVRE